MRNLLYNCKVEILISVLFLAMTFFPSLLFAADSAVPANEGEQAEILTAVQLRMQQKVSVDFRDTPIEDVLRMLAKQADVDIVKSPLVIGNVTATLTDVPLAEALDNILAAHGYGYIATENMIRILPRQDIYNAPEKTDSRVYKITYADVTELEKALTKFISKQGSISSMPGTSNIIVTDTESNLKAIEKFVKEVDRVTQQVLVEVRIYDVTDTDGFDLNINWNAGRNTKNAAGEFMTETTGDGIPYAITQPAVGDSVTTPPIQTSTKRADPFAAGSFDKTNGGVLRLGFLNNTMSLDVILSALQKQEWATLLANPSIMVLDNEKAKFEIIREIPYVENQTSSTGSSTMTSTQFKDVGVILEVTPHITRDDMLRLHIQPEFSVAEKQILATTGGYLVPAVNKRKLDTIALLKNGETVVLGGLRKQEAVKNLYKVPLLGDMPLLGGLFRSEEESSHTTELLIFITPKIIDVPVLQSRQTEVYKYTDIPDVNYPPLEHRE